MSLILCFLAVQQIAPIATMNGKDRSRGTSIPLVNKGMPVDQARANRLMSDENEVVYATSNYKPNVQTSYMF